MDNYISICSPARLSDGSTFNIIVDIDNNKIELVPDKGKSTIILDLICVEAFGEILQSLINCKGIQSALREKIVEHRGRYHAMDRSIS